MSVLPYVLIYFVLPFSVISLAAAWFIYWLTKDVDLDAPFADMCPLCSDDDLRVVAIGDDRKQVCGACHHQWPMQ